MKRLTKLVIGGVAACAVTLAVLGIYGFTGSDTEVLAAADQFQPPRDWVLTAETVTPDYRACWHARCPEVFRAWDAPVTVTNEYLQSALAGTALDGEISGECPRACGVEGAVGDLPFRITVNVPNSGASDREVKLTVG